MGLHTASALRGDPPGETDPLRILVVDDSVVVRALIAKWLEEDEVGTVVTAADGQQAINKLRGAPADVVTLDLEMPVLSGFDALPLIKKTCPDARVIVVSSLSTKGAKSTLRALELGATDFLPKPDSRDRTAFRREILDKVRALGGRRSGLAAKAPAAVRPQAPIRNARPRRSALPPSVVAVGCSTGGPEALTKFLRELGEDFSTPIMISQHMPATFTAILAKNLSRQTRRDVREAEEGELLQRGRVYIAPGDRHLLLKSGAQGMQLTLSSAPPEHHCRPAVDPMFRSIAGLCKERALAVVMTGMGHDGAAGSSEIQNAGGRVVVQDEATSVVWGMPGSVVAAGAADAVMTIEKLAAYVREACA